VLVPVESLTGEQVGGYGRYAGLPWQAQLDRFLFLHERDQALIGERLATTTGSASRWGGRSVPAR
jgi:hypothetical protein